AELKQIKSQLENGQIDKNEYKKCQKSILDAWVGKSSSNKTTKASNSNIIKASKDTSLYVVLQLDSNATNAEIRSNYKKLAKNYHPDKNNGIETPKCPNMKLLDEKCNMLIRALTPEQAVKKPLKDARFGSNIEQNDKLEVLLKEVATECDTLIQELVPKEKKLIREPKDPQEVSLIEGAYKVELDKFGAGMAGVLKKKRSNRPIRRKERKIETIPAEPRKILDRKACNESDHKTFEKGSIKKWHDSRRPLNGAP
ncbi:21450_t:CDS:2, partial [Gigaspora rosea]